MPVEADIAWAAGFFDGEGCISISRLRYYKSRTYHALQIRVVQKAKPPMTKLHCMFGGSLRKDRRGYWIWECNGALATEVLVQLEPFLVLKAKQARLAMRFQKTKDGVTRSETDRLRVSTTGDKMWLQLQAMKKVMT